MTGNVGFNTGYKANGDFGVWGSMPAKHVFVPGDMVCWHADESKVGMIISRVEQDVIVEGMSLNSHKARQTHTLYFYTVLWNTGKIKTAGEHATWQLKPFLKQESQSL